jgi:glycosyltransferase involved in cell wall biosynthesis
MPETAKLQLQLSSLKRHLVYSKLAFHLRSPGKRPWVVPRQAASYASREPFSLHAILGVFNEEDVIAETVTSLFAQGCDRVLLVDNDSTDDTVDRAVNAGAELAGHFSLPSYSEQARIAVMNAVVDANSFDASNDIWWIWGDGDEIVRPLGPGTIREYLETLDPQIRIVGSHYLDHWPDPGQPSGNGTVFSLAPLATHRASGPCALMHRKHPLQKYVRSKPRIRAENGFHRAASSELLYEPLNSPIITHHFPFRSRDVTVNRLEGLSSNGRIDAHNAELGKESNLSRRLREIDAVYTGKWDQLGLPSPPEPWEQLVRRIEHSL